MTLQKKSAWKLSLWVVLPSLFLLFFFDKLWLTAITRAERNLSPPIVSSASQLPLQKNTTPTCTPLQVAHRGNTRDGFYPQNSRQGVEAAVRNGIRNIEIDITFFEDEILLEHGPTNLKKGSHIKDWLKSNDEKNNTRITYQEFLLKFGSHFDLIILDLKELLTSTDQALELLSSVPLQREKHIVIGLNCNFVKKVQKKFNLLAGCESQGVFTNWWKGFEIWSDSYLWATQIQAKLNHYAKLKKIFWTYPTENELHRSCNRMVPDIAIVEHVTPKLE